MTFAAQMRVGSLEVMAALLAFGVIANRIRPGALLTVRRARALDVLLAVHDTPIGPAREVSLLLRAGEPPRIIGRSSQADVGVLDPEVSRRHAQLEFAKGIVYLEDLGSSNGTFLNGKAVADEAIEVRAGDDIDVGNTRITVVQMEPAPWT
jgi:hypothetical protein